jgi:hypothetical protein
MDIGAIIEDYQRKANWHRNMAKSAFQAFEHTQKAERFELIVKALTEYRERRAQ